MLTVLEFVTENPYTLTADHSVGDACKSMSEHNIRHIPIVNDNAELVSIVSQRDVLTAEDSSLVKNEKNRRSSSELIALAATITRSIQTTTENADLRAVAVRLQRNKLRCLPVVTNNKLVGIITDSDFFAIAINLIELLEMGESTEYEDGKLDRELDDAVGKLL
ncbi:MAG: CBS domain-containing membrane protein [Gammaproteobacteria bacterium]|jgi:CBS domain-containing membrane protein